MEKRFKGEVVSKVASRGSKSERKAVQIVTEGGDYILRRKGGHPFKDAILEELVGKKIEAQGRLRGKTLFLDDWEENAEPEEPCGAEESAEFEAADGTEEVEAAEAAEEALPAEKDAEA